jgi:2-dehydro-3-deoxyphosphogluconate aldolase/(4S)-4-hydroxy-2-oxoglutarate aldolase
MGANKFNWSLFDSCPLIAILRGYDGGTCEKLVEACAAGGITSIEVTLNTANALTTISGLSRQFSGRLNIGAGTVCTTSDVDAVVAAGASFIVTPITSAEVIRHAKNNGLAVFAGAFSPTEVFQAHSAGADAIKIFPADTLGPNYLKSILAPLAPLRLLPTGGITPETIPEYCTAGASGFGIGGSLFPKEALAAHRYEAVTEQARLFCAAWFAFKRAAAVG